MNTLVGQQLGKYKLTRLLGRGGMAEVYEALQPGLERLVAIKVLHRHQNITPEMIDRFKREARSIAQLRHPNIVQVFDFDVENDVYYMVMEMIPGAVLGLHLRHNGPMPVREALLIAMQLADALDYAHIKGVIHRDIKPTNVLFTDDRRKQVVLTDFGIALLTDATRLTVSTMMFGTPAYLSPEVGRGEQADERSDLYSLGVVLYEMVTGHTPFEADTTYGMIMQHIHQPLPPPRQFNANVPDVLERILYKTLAKNRKDRFQQARDLRNALQLVLDRLETENPEAALALPVKPAASNLADSRTRPLPVLDVDALDFPPSIAEKQIVPVAEQALAAAPPKAIEKPVRRRWRSAAALFLLGGVVFVGFSSLNELGKAALLSTASPTPTVESTSVASQTATFTLTATLTQTLTVTPSPTLTATWTSTATTTLTVTIEAGVTRVRPNVIDPTEKKTATPTTTPVRGTSPTPNRPVATQVIATQVVQPTQVQPTSIPPTSVPPTNPPPQPTAVPPTNPPPPEPTQVPIVPPVVATLVPPIINTLLPGLPGL